MTSDFPQTSRSIPIWSTTARAALATGAPIFTDAEMTASGITRRRLPAANDVRCLLHDPRVPELARRWQTTRTAAAVSLWGSDLEGAVVAIGNAPTALFHLLEVIAAGGPRPAAIVGIPVGFVGSAEVQDRVGREPVERSRTSSCTVVGAVPPSARRRQRARPSGGDLVSGRLYAVGVGPGDPDLLTVKASRLIASADVIAYHSGPHGSSIARSIVADLIPADAREELLAYPVTTGETDHPGGYAGVIADFYDASAERLAAHLDAGRTVAVLAEGDPALLLLVRLSP